MGLFKKENKKVKYVRKLQKKIQILDTWIERDKVRLLRYRNLRKHFKENIISITKVMNDDELLELSLPK